METMKADYLKEIEELNQAKTLPSSKLQNNQSGKINNLIEVVIGLKS